MISSFYKKINHENKFYLYIFLSKYVCMYADYFKEVSILKNEFKIATAWMTGNFDQGTQENMNLFTHPPHYRQDLTILDGVQLIWIQSLSFID